MSDPVREEWISTAAAGKTFAEVGGLWGTVNEQVTVAARAGATAKTMIDVAPSDNGGQNLWALFRERAVELGVTDVQCIEGNIDDLSTVEKAGQFDVVSCSGVLYHCPEPLLTLRHLRMITRETLILGTATIPESIVGPAGSISVEPGAALLAPALSHSQRAVLGKWLLDVGATHALGVNRAASTDWALEDYGAWWWFFTRDYVAALLRVAGFEVDNVASYWEGRATLYLAKVPPAAPSMQS
jgi:2-polyprenyl-3-methyl-5-hydroxy-6-metoxy-1,4-benzoquinol methylase